MKPAQLIKVISSGILLTPKRWQPEEHPRAPAAPGEPEPPAIFIVDDDSHVRAALRGMLEEAGRVVETYASGEAFLQAYRPGHDSCVLIDIYLPGMNGIDLLKRVGDAGHRLPAVMITGRSDVAMAVQAMKAGAMDFIEKPVSQSELIACIERALELSRDANALLACREAAAHHMASLTPRQRQIMDRVLSGEPSKNIAVDLGISQRTVENHRASIMKRKTGAESRLPALARLAIAAIGNDADGPAAEGGAVPASARQMAGRWRNRRGSSGQRSAIPPWSAAAAQDKEVASGGNGVKAAPAPTVWHAGRILAAGSAAFG